VIIGTQFNQSRHQNFQKGNYNYIWRKQHSQKALVYIIIFSNMVDKDVMQKSPVKIRQKDGKARARTRVVLERLLGSGRKGKGNSLHYLVREREYFGYPMSVKKKK